MKKEFLVGYTGFVGSNLLAKHDFTGCFDIKNIEEAFGERPDLLVYAGVPAEMYLADQDPAADRKIIQTAEENIRRISPKQIVLISTIAVYPDTHGADEDTAIIDEKLPAYGADRHSLEVWVEEHYENHLIVRLPALYGINLKKNFIYDYIHVIPALLTEKKLKGLAAREARLMEYYLPQNNGFFRCRELDADEKIFLKNCFQTLGFTALNFTDSRSRYQFYPLSHLWEHLSLALLHGLHKLNITTEPIEVAGLYYHLQKKTFQNELGKRPFDYDLRSKFASLFGGSNGYLMDRDEVLEDVSNFIRENLATD